MYSQLAYHAKVTRIDDLRRHADEHRRARQVKATRSARRSQAAICPATDTPSMAARTMRLHAKVV